MVDRGMKRWMDVLPGWCKKSIAAELRTAIRAAEIKDVTVANLMCMVE
jgi:hypothetical protein